jgi:hypothetical protein
MKATTWAVLAITASAGLLVAPRDARAETETFTATLLRDADLMSSGNRTWPLTFRVQNWTSEEDLARLDAVLKEGGPDALLREFQKSRTQAGYVVSSAIVREPSWRVAMATATDTPRGRVVRLVTDRPIGFAEAWGGSRSLDYPFAVFEFTLDAKGQGRGTAIAAARLVQDGNGTLAFETLPFTTGPDKLLGVRKWGGD